MISSNSNAAGLCRDAVRVDESKASKETVLLIEDAASLRLVYEAVVRRAGYEVVSAGDAESGRRLFESGSSRIVLLDLMLPDGDGLELMAEMLAARPETRVIVVTAHGSIQRAVEAMRAGAFDFLVKPFDDERLLTSLDNARRALGLRLTQPLPEDGRFEGFIGSSPAMREIYRKILGVAPSMATVFISGESGTGKELCARAIHRRSNRASGPFIALNCGAIPPDLLESEVFGHLKGSFTGAISDKVGAAAAADRGTLFLDEICEMDLALQTKLLRFIQTSTIQPVGAVRPRKVDVRIICATNRDPFEEVRQGRFREDLFYRLHVVPIRMPPLRERGEDVIEIAEALLGELAAEEGKRFRRLSPEVRELFTELPWPGNVRQLINVLRNVVVLNDGEVVTREMLPPELFRDARPAAAASEPAAPAAPAAAGLDGLIGRPLAEIERIVIERTIAHCGGSVTQAARLLGVSPSTIYRKREAWRRADGG